MNNNYKMKNNYKNKMIIIRINKIVNNKMIIINKSNNRIYNKYKIKIIYNKIKIMNNKIKKIL